MHHEPAVILPGACTGILAIIGEVGASSRAHNASTPFTAEERQDSGCVSGSATARTAQPTPEAPAAPRTGAARRYTSSAAAAEGDADLDALASVVGGLLHAAQLARGLGSHNAAAAPAACGSSEPACSGGGSSSGSRLQSNQQEKCRDKHGEMAEQRQHTSSDACCRLQKQLASGTAVDGTRKCSSAGGVASEASQHSGAGPAAQIAAERRKNKAACTPGNARLERGDTGNEGQVSPPGAAAYLMPRSEGRSNPPETVVPGQQQLQVGTCGAQVTCTTALQPRCPSLQLQLPPQPPTGGAPPTGALPARPGRVITSAPSRRAATAPVAPSVLAEMLRSQHSGRARAVCRLTRTTTPAGGWAEF
jgi:hypothetical protein